jgi:hypothetical protein
MPLVVLMMLNFFLEENNVGIRLEGDFSGVYAGHGEGTRIEDDPVAESVPASLGDPEVDLPIPADSPVPVSLVRGGNLPLFATCRPQRQLLGVLMDLLLRCGPMEAPHWCVVHLPDQVFS